MSQNNSVTFYFNVEDIQESSIPRSEAQYSLYNIALNDKTLKSMTVAENFIKDVDQNDREKFVRVSSDFEFIVSKLVDGKWERDKYTAQRIKEILDQNKKERIEFTIPERAYVKRFKNYRDDSFVQIRMPDDQAKDLDGHYLVIKEQNVSYRPKNHTYVVSLLADKNYVVYQADNSGDLINDSNYNVVISSKEVKSMFESEYEKIRQGNSPDELPPHMANIKSLIPELNDEQLAHYKQLINHLTQTINRDLTQSEVITLENDWLRHYGFSHITRAIRELNNNSSNKQVKYPMNYVRTVLQRTERIEDDFFLTKSAEVENKAHFDGKKQLESIDVSEYAENSPQLNQAIQELQEDRKNEFYFEIRQILINNIELSDDYLLTRLLNEYDGLNHSDTNEVNRVETTIREYIDSFLIQQKEQKEIELRNLLDSTQSQPEPSLTETTSVNMELVNHEPIKNELENLTNLYSDQMNEKSEVVNSLLEDLNTQLTRHPAIQDKLVELTIKKIHKEVKPLSFLEHDSLQFEINDLSDEINALAQQNQTPTIKL